MKTMTTIGNLHDWTRSIIMACDDLLGAAGVDDGQREDIAMIRGSSENLLALLEQVAGEDLAAFDEQQRQGWRHDLRNPLNSVTGFALLAGIDDLLG